MLLGHLGAALAGRSVARKAPLWVLLVASKSFDLLCFGLVAAGIERTQWTPAKRTLVAEVGLLAAGIAMTRRSRS